MKLFSLLRSFVKLFKRRLKIAPASIHLCSNTSATSVFSSHTVTLETTKDVNSNLNHWFMGYEALVPAAYLYQIRDGKVLVGREEVFSHRNCVYDELTTQPINRGRQLPLTALSNPFRVSGSLLSLSLSSLENNYYHFLTEFLARWWIYENSTHSADTLIFPQYLPFQVEIADILGIEQKSILNLPSNTCVQSDLILFPSFINNSQPVFLPSVGFDYRKIYLPSWMRDFNHFLLQKCLRRQISNLTQNLPIAKSDCRKIYLSRTNASKRRVLNEQLLCEFLKSLGFLILELEFFSVSEQAFIFSNANIVIAPHGAGLANIIFCQHGTKILELHPDRFQDSSYYITSQLMSLDYSYLIGTAPLQKELNPKHRDFYVDIDAIVQWLLDA